MTITSSVRPTYRKKDDIRLIRSHGTRHALRMTQNALTQNARTLSHGDISLMVKPTDNLCMLCLFYHQTDIELQLSEPKKFLAETILPVNDRHLENGNCWKTAASIRSYDTRLAISLNRSIVNKGDSSITPSELSNPGTVHLLRTNILKAYQLFNYS